MRGRRPPLGIAPLRARVLREATVVAAATLALAVASFAWDLPSMLSGWAREYIGFLDDAVLLLAASHLFMIVFGARRAGDLKKEFARRSAAETQLRHRARHDGLTGLLNRTAICEDIEQAVEEAAAGGPSVAVVLLDLDRFKEVNDTLGHQVGDVLLQTAARRLAGVLRDGAALARLGGDEFVVLLRGCSEQEARLVAGRALAAMRRPFELDGLALEVDGSFGIAMAPSGPDPVPAAAREAASVVAADLLRRADVAMYAAKGDHSGVVVHAPALDVNEPERLTLCGELRRGIGEGQLRVHYQPKVGLRESRVVGVEALVRWQHPRRGLLAPGEFIDIAEQTGLVGELTDAVLDQALADCRRWRDDGLFLPVAVNLSTRSLVDAGLPERVAALLDRHGLPGDCLELEITESAAVKDPGRALEVLHRLRGLGLHLSVDDYGTGHASLAYLTRLPVGSLKIDKSFVSTMELAEDDRTIVRSTIELGHSLGLRVVAEGVETRETWRTLLALGCDEAQGFWLARPAPAEALPATVGAIAEQLTADAAGTSSIPS